MNTWTTPFTAAEAVSIGACAGPCLVASRNTCDCVCAGAYHGVLAGAVIGTATHSVTAAHRGAIRNASQRSNTLTKADLADRLITLRVEGKTYREISTVTGVSTGIVRRRLREFTEQAA